MHSLPFGPFSLLPLFALVLPVAAQGHKLNDPGRVTSFQVSPDGSRVVYETFEERDPDPVLYSVSTGVRRQRTQLSEGVDIGWMSPDGVHMVIQAALDAPDLVDLYSLRVDGTGSPIRLTPVPVGGEVNWLWDVVFGPRGRNVAFNVVSGTPEGIKEGDAQIGLYVAPVDGSAPATLLVDGTFGPGPRLSLFGGVENRFSADESRIFFFEGEFGDIYSMPLDASSAPVRLNAPGQGLRPGLQVSEDGRVFYRASLTGSIQYELFVVPADGSEPPRRLSGPLAPGGFVHTFALTADASHVVYQADPDGLGRYELFSVPTDGSAEPVRLHAPLPAGRGVLAYRVAPDGTRVAFTADLSADDVRELFSAPIDGSAAPVRISPDLVSNGGVANFEIRADSRRVVYRADAELDGVFSLYSSPLVGPRGTVRLSPTPSARRGVTSFRLSADGTVVAFTVPRDNQGHTTLFRSASAGEEKASEIAGPFPTQTHVWDYLLSTDGSVVVYGVSGVGVSDLYCVRTPVAAHGRKL